MLEFLLDPATYLSLLSLSALVIVLDVDIVIFMSILTISLDESQQNQAKKWGFIISIIIRALLLSIAGFLLSHNQPLFSVWQNAFTLKDLVTLGGGVFLLYKATTEIHDKLEGEESETKTSKNFSRVLGEIVIVNIVFSIDSVITAIGMTNHTIIMIIAMVISLSLMFIFQKKIDRFIKEHPTLKILALSFILLIGVLLVVEGVHIEKLEIPKGYIYFAMAFSLGVELLNIKIRKRGAPLQLHQKHLPPAEKTTTLSN
ncbi:MAG: TerC family protein [Bacteroidia bacterium]|nr:TerC family protein [Bacteroidia bacterium]MDW8157915.1 TerC family protein [Bacteroidia bacterium]